MMRRLTIFFIIYVVSLTAFGQRPYFRTDSVSYYGYKIIDNGSIKNAIQCEVEMNKESKVFSPYEVLEYGDGNEWVYVSKNIQVGDSMKRVFLRQLIKGKTTLYVYNGKKSKVFYISKDNVSLIRLSKYDQENKKVDFRIDLSKITEDCQNTNDAIKLVTYTDKSLSRLIKDYDKCSSSPFPFVKYGFILGYGSRDIEIVGSKFSEYKSFVNNMYKSSILPGFFIDYPISMSYFSFHADAYLSRYRYSFTNTLATTSFDFVANTMSIHLPLLVRYTFQGKSIRPFINGGLNGIYNMQNSTSFYKTLITPDYVEFESVNKNFCIPKYQIGLSVGAGIEYKLNYRRSVFIEFRYNKQLRTSNTNIFNNTQLELLTGINI